MKNLLIALALLLCSTDSFAINIKSLEGKSSTVYISLQAAQNVIIITNGIDTLLLGDVTRLLTVNVVKKNFLKLRYKRRGGSGVRNTYEGYYCISNSRIFESAMYLSKEQDFIIIRHRDNDLSTKRVTAVDIQTTIIKRNKLQLIVRSKNSKTLDFNWHKRIFYHGHSKLNGLYTNVNLVTNKHQKKRLYGPYPFSIFGPSKYYYIDEHWCSLDNNHTIVEYSK